MNWIASKPNLLTSGLLSFWDFNLDAFYFYLGYKFWMGKSQDAKKETKKAPQKTAKEKKAAKREKKNK